MLRKNGQRVFKRVGSTLLILSLVFGVLTGMIVGPLAQSASAAATPLTEAQCVAVGDTWQRGDASNRGVSKCVGRATCASTGGIWNPATKTCTTIPPQILSGKSATLSASDRAKAYALYKAVYYCIDEYLKTDITHTNIDADGEDTSPTQGYWYGDGPNNPDKKRTGTWPFYSYPIAQVNYMGDSDSGCSQLTVDAVNFFDLGTPAKLLRTLNYEFIGKDEKWKANGKVDANLFKQAVEKAEYSTQLTDEIQYHLTRKAFQAFCRPTLLGEFESQSKARKEKIESYNRASGNLPAQAKIADLNANAVRVVNNAYEYQFGPQDGANRMESMWVIFEDGDRTFDNSRAAQTCNTMVDTLNSTVVASLNNILVAACQEKKITATAALQACMAGLQMRDIDGYCEMVFSDKKAQDYCNQGRGATIASPGEDSTDQNEGEDERSNSCVIEGLGWIVCPVLTFVSQVTDSIYGLISDWLTVDVDLIATGTATHRGWQAIRDIANVGFVIIFLIVIFSQLTGTGISNYGVKKILPRLVVMAIVINTSFFITQIMVDLSNILGGSLRGFFNGIDVFGMSGGFFSTGNNFTDIGGKLMTGGVVAGLAGAAITGTVIYGGVGLFLMILLAAFLAVAVTMLILAARQALVVVLIVLAPLAFLAMVLPNTKKWYDTWLKMFVSLLVIYPMVALMFGASELAAKILVQQNVLLGLAVATIPLFATIPMLRGSLKAIPFAGNLASKLTKGASLSGNVKSGYKQARKNAMADFRSRALSSESKGRAARAARWIAGGQARSAARDRRFGAGAAEAEAIYTAQRALAEGSGASNSEQASALAALRKIQEEEISNIIALDSKGSGKTPKELLDRITDKNATKQEKIAAIRQIEARGGMNNRLAMAKLTSDPALKGDGEDVAEIRQNIVASTAKMGDANLSYGGASLPLMQAGTFDHVKAHVDHANSTAFSANSLLSMHPAAREEFISAIQSAQGDDAVRARGVLAKVKEQIQNNPNLDARADTELIQKIDKAIAGSVQAARTEQTVQIDQTQLSIEHPPAGEAPSAQAPATPTAPPNQPNPPTTPPQA